MESNNAEDETQTENKHDNRVDLQSRALISIQLCIPDKY